LFSDLKAYIETDVNVALPFRRKTSRFFALILPLVAMVVAVGGWMLFLTYREHPMLVKALNSSEINEKLD